LLDLMRQYHPPAGEVVSAVESDVALSVAALRWANRARNGAGPVTSVPAAADVLGELPNAAAARRATEPSPLSDRETEIIRGLAEGKVYKAIASDLGLSTSTVRTHLHNTYGKLGAVDRAQCDSDRYRARLAVAGASGRNASRRRRSRTAMAAPVASIATSMGEPVRPATNVWWYSSMAPYPAAIRKAVASAGRVAMRDSSARNHRKQRSPYWAAWISFLPIRSNTPSPDERSGWDEKNQITAINTTGGAHGPMSRRVIGTWAGREAVV
jgi:DNA-binding CsgD family transcriptional regulator